MTRSIPESDWKLFRQIHPVAVDRFCQAILDEIAKISSRTDKTPHERYLEIYKLIQRRDRMMAEAFNDLRRSTALIQIAAIHSRNLITEEEIARFSQETREVIDLLSTSRA